MKYKIEGNKEKWPGDNKVIIIFVNWQKRLTILYYGSSVIVAGQWGKVIPFFVN